MRQSPAEAVVVDGAGEVQGLAPFPHQDPPAPQGGLAARNSGRSRLLLPLDEHGVQGRTAVVVPEEAAGGAREKRRVQAATRPDTLSRSWSAMVLREDPVRGRVTTLTTSSNCCSRV
jgi:hypothetical protein